MEHTPGYVGVKPTMSSMMGMICSWRERGNPSPSQTVAFSFCTREDSSTGLPMAVREGDFKYEVCDFMNGSDRSAYHRTPCGPGVCGSTLQWTAVEQDCWPPLVVAARRCLLHGPEQGCHRPRLLGSPGGGWHSCACVSLLLGDVQHASLSLCPAQRLQRPGGGGRECRMGGGVRVKREERGWKWGSDGMGRDERWVRAGRVRRREWGGRGSRGREEWEESEGGGEWGRDGNEGGGEWGRGEWGRGEQGRKLKESEEQWWERGEGRRDGNVGRGGEWRGRGGR